MNVGYIATPFGETELGASVGVIALLVAGLIVIVVGVRGANRIGNEIEAARMERYKKEMERE